jgi:uncharacterized protein (DUF433 family)
MAAKVLPCDTIVRDPDIRGGRPIIAGTSLRVSDIAAYHIHGGLPPEELAVQFHLELAQVHAALSYYFTHRTEIQAEIQQNAEQAEKWRQVLSPEAS